MSMSNWFYPLLSRNTTPAMRSQSSRWKYYVPRLECLEDRVVPATTITILDAGVGTLDGFLSATDGTIAAADNAGAAGSVSRAALQGVNADVSISITAETSIVVADLTSPLALQTGVGFEARFIASAAAFTFSDTSDTLNTAGANVVLVAQTSLTTGSVVTNGGDITLACDDIALNAAINAGVGRVTLAPVTAGRQIDLGTNTAGKLGLTAAELNTITAHTLQIGNSSSGDITVSNAITPTSVPTLDLETGGGISETNVPFEGTITVANLAIHAVNAVEMFQDNNVTTGAMAAECTGANQPFTFVDASDVNIGSVDGLNGITTNAGALGVTAFFGNLTVNNNVSAGTGIVDFQGLGPESIFTNNAIISISGGFGQIGITSNRMALNGNPGTSAIIAAGDGRVMLDPDYHGVRSVDLGSTGDPPGSLNLSNAELNTVTAGALWIGLAGVGNVAISSAIAVTQAPRLVILAGGSIQNNPVTATITATSLNFQAGNAVSITGANSVSGQFGAFVANAGQGFTFNNAGDLDITGITAHGGAIAVSTTDGNLTVDQNVTAGAAPVNLTAGCTAAHPDNTLTNNAAITGNSARLTANRMILNAGTIEVGTTATNIVTLQPCTAGRAVDLGGNGDANGALRVSQNELNTITSGIVRVGSPTAGNLNITSVISGAAQFATLSLISSGVIAQSGAGAVNVNHFVAQGAGGVSMAVNANTVTGNLAGRTTNHSFVFVNAATLSLGTADGRSGINIGSGTAGLRADGSAILNGLAAGNAVTAGALGLNATGGIGTPAKSLTLAVGLLTTKSGNAAQFLTSAGTTTVNSLASGTAGIVLTGGRFALSGSNQISATTPVRLSGATLNVSVFSNAIAALTLSSSSTLGVLINSFSAGNFGNLTVNQLGYNLGNATLNLSLKTGFVAPPSGSAITLIRDTNNAGVLGTFAGLPEGTVFVIGGFSFRISYQGGAGHDVTLTKV